ncbi:hypothetical protein CXB51_028586 [Gossypium anomalum]|uniref:Integrase catalytic domain-containing protein n=1 Tax=Gossypium anomalum TaxID=47600 RepID=A0A8J5YCQ3_9ROSI|nr:hypothetical protein CXB51_028586 [Gossypium anomalum]
MEFDLKVACLKHDLHSIKRGDLSIARYLAQIKQLCDLLLASGHTLSDKEQVHVVLAGFSIEFESVITMATFSSVLLSMKRLVEILLECKNCQRRFVVETLIHANPVQKSSKDPDLGSPRSFRPPSAWCYYRYDRSSNNAQVSSLPRPSFDDVASFSYSATATRNPRARCFQGSNHDAAVGPFVQGPLMECVGIPQIPNVSGFEYLNGNGFEASVGSNFCVNTINTEEPYIPKLMKNNNNTLWYPELKAIHHVCKEASSLNISTPYPGKISLLMRDCTHAKIEYVGNSTLATENKLLHLSNVLDVPNIRKNLLSGHTHEGLYRFSPVVNRVTPSVTMSTLSTELGLNQSEATMFDLWHRRLSHPSSNVRKSQAITCFLQFQQMVKIQFGKNVKQVQSDWGGEYRSFTSILSQQGIVHRATCLYTSEQNGVVERKHQHIVEAGLTFLAQANLPMHFWGYAFTFVVHLINCLSTPILQGQFPFSIFLSPYTNNAMNSLEHDNIVSSSTPVPAIAESLPTPILSTIVAEPSSPDHESHTIDKALATLEWKKATQDEFDALIRNSTWTLVPLPPDKKAIGCKWLFKIKKSLDGTLASRKGRTIHSIVVPKRQSIRHVDVNNAFLNALYGLHKALRALFDKLKSYLVSIGFVGSKSNASLFICITDKTCVYVLVYIDDIIITRDFHQDTNMFVQRLNSESSLKDIGELHYFLGVEVTRLADGSLHLSQFKYILVLLDCCHMMHAKDVHTPMLSSSYLSKTLGNLVDDPSEYRSLARALQYVVLTRLDIVYAVNRICQFMHNSTDIHPSSGSQVNLSLFEWYSGLWFTSKAFGSLVVNWISRCELGVRF